MYQNQSYGIEIRYDYKSVPKVHTLARILSYHSAPTYEGNSNYPRKNGGRTRAASDWYVLFIVISGAVLMAILTLVICHNMNPILGATFQQGMAF